MAAAIIGSSKIWPHEQTAEAAGLYEAGWSSGRLARRFGVSADTILKGLRSAGVKIRPRRGGPARNRALA